MAGRTKSRRMKRRDKEKRRLDRAARRRRKRREAAEAAWEEYVRQQPTYTLEELAERWGCSPNEARQEAEWLVEQGVYCRIDSEAELPTVEPGVPAAVESGAPASDGAAITLERFAFLWSCTVDEARERVEMLAAVGLFEQVGLEPPPLETEGEQAA